jgi:U4/U6 small nuclear ribonucleoprotein PRP3
MDDVAAKKAETQRKINEFKAKMAAKQQQAAAPPPPQEMSEKERWRAEAIAKAAELAKSRHTTATPTPAPAVPAPPRQEGRGARGGLGIGLHPSLVGNDLTGSRGGPQGPKFSTTKGNQQQQPDKPRPNPYSVWEDDPTTAASANENPAFQPNARKYESRKSKPLVFSEKGKYMAQANALRAQAKLEEMKRRMAAESRSKEIEEASDKAFLVPAPPEIEWWDEGLLAQRSYENWDAPGRNKISAEDSIITILIQHPVTLAPPQDKFIPEPKPLMLTVKEQKKLRRQRRMAEMKEEQAKIRLGLVEPPPPKVKKSNMMRVLGEQAVKDPTAVEARVNREIAQRANDHEQANADRALTHEEKLAKLAKQQAGDEAKGVKVVVFRVDDLSSGKHRYQIDINAKQTQLTGIVVLNPGMNLIVVEGGAHSIKAYKKLMLNRVKWTENTPPVATDTTFVGTTDGSNANIGSGTRGTGSKAAEWCSPLDERGDLKDLSENRCVLVWEGEAGQRAFKRWGSRACETDGEAKDVLSRTKMENMWTLARSK